MSSIHETFLTARPEDVLHACIAYNRPEMLALDSLIRLQSSKHLSPRTRNSSPLFSLPPEILLRVREDLHACLRDAIAEDTAMALREYEASLVEGICPDCYWWNVDVYGPDVWTWVENGYCGACNCVVTGDSDPRVFSAVKQRTTRTYEGLRICSRAIWLRAYVSRTHLHGARTPDFLRDNLAEFGCRHRLSTPQCAEPIENVPFALKKAQKYTPPCDFGPLIVISQSEERSAAEDSKITIQRLKRELGITSYVDDEPSIAFESSSSTNYVDLVYKRNACEMHFRTQRSAACNCIDCLRSIFATPSSLATYALAKSGDPSRISRLFPSNAVLAGLLCAASAAYFVARVVS